MRNTYECPEAVVLYEHCQPVFRKIPAHEGLQCSARIARRASLVVNYGIGHVANPMAT